MTQPSEFYRQAEIDMAIPPVSERGRTNQNPADIGFWALIAEDFRTHERKLFEQGFWAIFVHRFGNWRMGQPKLIRAPSTLLYRIMFKLIEWICGISLWYTVKLGRRVRIWHHSGMSLGARAIGDDSHIRQNTTLGIAQTGVNDALPIIGAGADIGAGVVVAGSVYIGKGAKVGANALVLYDVPDGATAMGNPAQIINYGSSADDNATVSHDNVATNETMPSAPKEERMLVKPRSIGKIALLGSANLDYLGLSFAEVGSGYGLEIETYIPPFGQARMELLQDDSPLIQSDATAALIIERAEDVLGDIYSAPLSLAPDDVDSFLDAALEPMLSVIKGARERLTGPIFVAKLAILSRSTLMQADAPFGRGLGALIDRANGKISEAAAALDGVHLLETREMIAEVGRTASSPGSFWHLGRVPYSEAFNKHLAKRVIGAILALKGATVRLLVLDLDNTLWGGVLGEDGMEGLDIGGAYPGSAYRSFQDAILALSQRGIALAVASKNDEDLALTMIADHPEMAIRPDDIVAHRIGWSEKALGIEEMLEELSLGAANTMFIDDNPVEREKVRANIPDIIVPPFPDAPEDLVSWLLENPFLETLELTDSDLKRTAQYRTRAKVTAAKRDFTNIADFYRDLGMTLVFEPYDVGNQKRVLQLFVKTNQFNATGRRHDAASVDAIIADGGEVYAIGVSDRHTGYELMGVMVLRPDASMKLNYPEDGSIQSCGAEGDFWVDNFLLSCRILGRTIEDAIVAWASERVLELGGSRLLAQVIESPRNTPVRRVFSKAGMTPVPDAPDMGEGGIYMRDLTADGTISVPDYFTIGNTPPTLSTPAKTSAVQPPKPVTMPKTELKKIPASIGEKSLPLDQSVEAKLAQVFRSVFGLSSDIDLDNATMDNVSSWDSLGHLRLAMQIEQRLKIKIPGDQLSVVRTYTDLRAALANRS